MGSSPIIATIGEVIMETVIVEIKAAEGGEDSKLLVNDMLRAYNAAAQRRCL